MQLIPTHRGTGVVEREEMIHHVGEYLTEYLISGESGLNK